ncbi:UDP-3-O-(3-hydroxymyristoyl)glucosamine N-acyltransferase, partial [candidate division KSB3 bacterium]|nr:UDP-3-O-(3-hydroxymyristoyl)glucosamine N-acyltransferase [candidate division KSB3 bacterium]MBD3325541.1 UDP-3-O-(3-hydroxymyristoyl)glucosamine N-acyltransferase [candidate division KSB3 bacterium]
QGTVIGAPQTVISSVAGIEDAQPGQITFLANPKYHPKLEHTAASAVIVAPNVTAPNVTLLQVPNPYLAFAKILTLFAQKHHPPVGIHATCIRGTDVTLDDHCAIGAHVTIGNHVTIGARTILYPGVVIGDHVTIGADTLIYPNVSILQDVTIGNRVIIHSGAVIGSDGFGFAPTEDHHYYKIPQIGKIQIDDDVEIGANVTIDRATIGTTHIHQGVKIDNLVQIAHNVEIGEHTVIVAQVGIAGSTKVGSHVTLAGQVGVAGHIQIGDHAIIGGQAGVTKSVPDKAVRSGTPAVDQHQWKKSQIALLKLPEALKTIHTLEQRLQALERQRSQQQRNDPDETF